MVELRLSELIGTTEAVGWMIAGGLESENRQSGSDSFTPLYARIPTQLQKRLRLFYGCSTLGLLREPFSSRRDARLRMVYALVRRLAKHAEAAKLPLGLGA